MNGMTSMQKIISESGKRTIEAFVRENLAGRVSDETIAAYVGMAESQMKIHGGLPCLEISMCFSLTGDQESLELDESDVTYADCVLEGEAALADVFGADFPTRLQAARKAEGVHDGYHFAVEKESGAPDGAARYAVHCLGPDGA